MLLANVSVQNQSGTSPKIDRLLARLLTPCYIQETFLSSSKVAGTSQSTSSEKEPRAQTWSRRVDQALIDQMSESEKRRQKWVSLLR